MSGAVAEERKLSKKEVMRYATEQLHAVRPQPPGIPDMLAALDNAITEGEETAAEEAKEQPPKDVSEAISRIDAKVGQLEHPPKAKPDLKKIAEPPKAENAKHEAKPASKDK